MTIVYRDDDRLAFQYVQYLFQLHPHLADNLLAAVYIVVGAFAFELLAGATDGETLFIQQTSNLANHDHVTALIIAAVPATFDRLELFELLLPIAEHMRLDATQFAYFANRKITFGWYRG